MISHKYKCIFIHIPKTAGSSVEKKLGLFNELYWGAQDHSTIKDIQPITFSTAFMILTRQHEGLSRRTILKKILKAYIHNSMRISKKSYKTYFKFTIVRNPWDRIYSLYKNAMCDPRHGIPNCDFITYIREHGDNWALKPQTYWITDFNNKIPLDLIVKFENLAKEMPQVLRRLGFSDTTLPHLLDSSKSDRKSKNFRDVYDSYSVEIIAERYREEIALFGYRFE
ncbi:MAG: sulfotransferase family 2 domain-containing protein [Candidatus Hermodarchaeota archaeon]